MVRHAWLTPDDDPGTLVCHPVLVPAGSEYEAAFRGAMLLLADPANWEKVGTADPETIAYAFLQAFLQTTEQWGSGCA